MGDLLRVEKERVLALMIDLHVEIDKKISNESSTDDMLTLIQDLSQKHASPDDDSIKIALQLTLDNKISSVKWSSKDQKHAMRRALSVSLEFDMNEKKKSAFLRFIKLIQNLETIVNPMIEMGKDSEAHLNAQQRETARIERLNTWVETYDHKIYGDIPKYIELAEKISSSRQLNKEDLNAFIRSLSGKEPTAYEKIIYGTRRSAATFMSRFVVEHLHDSMNINKSQRAQINILKTLVDECQKNGMNDAIIDKALADIIQQKRLQNDREAQKPAAILKRYFKGKIGLTQTAQEIKETATHPIKKVIDNPSLNTWGKTKKIVKKIVEKGGQPISGFATMTRNSTQSLVRNTIQQPAAVVIKTGLSAFNLLEFLYLSIHAEKTADATAKAALKQQAEGKLSNLQYNAVQAVAATIASAATAASIASTVSSAGIGIPAFLGVKSIIIAHALEIMDTAQNVYDAVELVSDVAETVKTSTTHQTYEDLVDAHFSRKNSSSTLSDITTDNDLEFTDIYQQDVQDNVDASLNFKQIFKSLNTTKNKNFVNEDKSNDFTPDSI